MDVSEEYLPRCSMVIAPYGQIGELSVHIKQSTPILISKLATACVFRCRPTTSNSLRVPSLSPKDLSVPTISSNKGS